MSRRVAWTRPAQHDLERLDRQTLQRITDAVMRFAATGHGDVRRLHGQRDEWRLRVGDWRVRFTLREHNIVVLRVLPRGSAYR